MRPAVEWDVWFAYPGTTIETRFGTYSTREAAHRFARLLRRTHGAVALIRVVRVSITSRIWQCGGVWLTVCRDRDGWRWTCARKKGWRSSFRVAVETAEREANP